jgi:hypothetical protein
MGVSNMVRRVVIASIAAAAVIAGSTSGAWARGGGHGGGGHGFGGGHGGFGGGFAHVSAFHSTGFAVRSVSVQSAGIGHFAAVHPTGINAGRVAFGHRFGFRHHFVHNRFAFIGGAYPYGYDDDCYSRVWTPWGWRWQYACY